MSGRSFFSFASVLSCALFAAGCIDTSTARLARHDLQSPLPSTTTSIIPETGIYKVKWTARPGEHGSIAGSERILRVGQEVGFTTTEEGQVLAIAGDERFAVEPPGGTRRLIWYARREEPSDLTTAGAGVAMITVNSAALVGVLALDAALESLGDDNSPDEEHGGRGREHDRLYKVHK